MTHATIPQDSGHGLDEATLALLREEIGQALSEALTDTTAAERPDWHDAREVDRVVDQLLPVMLRQLASARTAAAVIQDATQAAIQTAQSMGAKPGAGQPAEVGIVPFHAAPPAIYRHPALGNLFDRLQLHSYALGYAKRCGVPMAVIREVAPDVDAAWLMQHAMPSEEQILTAAEEAGLLPNTAHHWVPAFRRYHELLNRTMSSTPPPTLGTLIEEIRDEARDRRQLDAQRKDLPTLVSADLLETWAERLEGLLRSSEVLSVAFTAPAAEDTQQAQELKP